MQKFRRKAEMMEQKRGFANVFSFQALLDDHSGFRGLTGLRGTNGAGRREADNYGEDLVD